MNNDKPIGQPPERLAPILETIEKLYSNEVKPREKAVRHRLENRDDYLSEDGKLHPEIWDAKKEIMIECCICRKEGKIIEGFLQ